jgi:CheY-like chemotaxis protein
VILAVPDAVWPVIAVVVLVVLLALIFRRTIEEVLLPRVSGVKVLGLEVSFAKEELDKAATSRGLSKGTGDQKAALERAREAAPLLRGAEVLWVDDDPSRNRPERRMLQAFGVMIDTVTTNADALEMLKAHHYDVVITDIDREGDPDDGIALANRIGPSELAKPLIFYVTDLKPGTPAYAFAITDRPDHLLHYVIDVLARWRRDAARG